MEPYSAAQPGSRLEAGAQLKALRKARSKLVAEKKDPLAMMKALGAQAAAAKAKAAGGAGGLAARDLYRRAPALAMPLTCPEQQHKSIPAGCREGCTFLRAAPTACVAGATRVCQGVAVLAMRASSE